MQCLHLAASIAVKLYLFLANTKLVEVWCHRCISPSPCGQNRVCAKYETSNLMPCTSAALWWCPGGEKGNPDKVNMKQFGWKKNKWVHLFQSVNWPLQRSLPLALERWHSTMARGHFSGSWEALVWCAFIQWSTLCGEGLGLSPSFVILPSWNTTFKMWFFC